MGANNVGFMPLPSKADMLEVIGVLVLESCHACKGG